MKRIRNSEFGIWNICRHRLHSPFPIPRSPLNTGLTFVELLLAVAVFAILLTGLSSHLRGSVVAWRRVTSSTEALQRVRVTVERITRDVANAVVFDPSKTWQPAPEFSSARLLCYTVGPVSSETDSLSQVVFVAYAVESTASGTALTRTVKTVQEAAAGQEGRTERLLDGVQAFTLQYGVWPQRGEQLEWKETWEDVAKLPKLVRVTATLTASPVTAIDHMMLSPTGSAVSP